MALFLTPGRKAAGFAYVIKEMHEPGLWLILAFLAIHVSAVALHAYAGKNLWRKMFFLER
jgi:cytochrome b561